MSRSDAAAKSAAIFALGLIFRLGLIYAFPIVFGGDTILHLANRDHILLSHQLPLLQVVIYAVSHISETLVVMRIVMALIGAVSGVAFYFFVRGFATERSASWAALLFTFNPFLVELSIVPFQETLMSTCLLFALGFYFRQRDIPAAAWMAAACMTRYEAWVFVPFMIIDRRSLKALLFAIAPLTWLIAHQGLSSPGTFVVEWPHSFARVERWAYLAWITFKNTAIPVALAVSGIWSIYKAKRFTDRRLLLLTAATGLFLVTILFSAHGSAPDPERYVSSREAVLLIAMVTLLAAIGLDAIWDCKRPWLSTGLAVLGLAIAVVDAPRDLKRDTSAPHLQLSYQLAQYLDRAVRPGEIATIVAKPNDVSDFLNKVREREGDAGVARAKQMTADLDNSPVDCLRTIVHSRLGRAQLSCTRTDAPWIAVWSDALAAAPPKQLRDTLRSGNGSVAIYR